MLGFSSLNGDLNVRVLGVQNTRDRAGPFAKTFLWQLRTHIRSQREEQILAQGEGGNDDGVAGSTCLVPLPPPARLSQVSALHWPRLTARFPGDWSTESIPAAVGSRALAVESAGRSGACLSVSGGALVSAAMGATRSSSPREMEPGESLAGHTGMDGAISLQEQRKNALS